jgi:LPPG:FO 2-phospho-L-lactate transferase
MADACLAAIGVETSAQAVGMLYADLLDGWLVAEADAGVEVKNVVVRTRPLLMTDVPAAAALASAALDLAGELRR